LNHSTPCPVCRTDDSFAFFEVDAQPVLIGLKCATPASAIDCRRGDIRLHCCRGCGFVWNVLFDPDAMGYDEQYENSLHFSRVFRDYTTGVVDRLVDRYPIEGGLIVDIGCGKGDFLAELCEKAQASGLGYDPSYEGERVQSTAAERIEWFKDYFDPERFDRPFDLITSRYVLEHIPEPRRFVESLSASMRRLGSGQLYFEVPDIDLIVNQGSLWDVIYEHCSYFGVESLAELFRLAGFAVQAVTQGYQKQFVAVEAAVDDEQAGDTGRSAAARDVVASAERFGAQASQTLTDWQASLDDWRDQGRTVALWGAGAKTVSFLNMIQDASGISLVVDINPHKVDHYIPGTGHAVRAPEALVELEPDVVVMMNPIYRKEIESQLGEMGLAPQTALLY